MLFGHFVGGSVQAGDVVDFLGGCTDACLRMQDFLDGPSEGNGSPG